MHSCLNIVLKLISFSESDREVMLCAQRDCRQVDAATRERLPTELYDLVHSYLIPHNKVISLQDMLPEEYNSNNNCRCFPRAPLRDWILFSSSDYPHATEHVSPERHIFDPEFLSREFTLEAARSYYRLNTFKIDVPCRSFSILRILTDDCFKLGLEPSSLIRQLHIELPTETCPWYRAGRRGKRGSNATEKRRLRICRRVLTKDLALIPLMNLHGMHITISVVLEELVAYSAEERSLLNILYAIQSIVFDLKRNGSKVTICVMRSSGKRVDISHLFQPSSEELQEVRIYVQD